MTHTPLVKICGLCEPETLRAALAASADMVGFVFFEKSPRNVSLQTAGELSAIVRARSEARIVALTVDASDALLREITTAAGPDIHQLHGREDEARAADVARRFAPVMKALPVRSPGDVARASAYVGAGATILFDAPAPVGSAIPGGNAHSFDWTHLANAPVPFLLAGGLTPENVADAIAVPGCVGVDVSSGVERAKGVKGVKGVKDADLIRAFIQAAKGAGKGAAA